MDHKADLLFLGIVPTCANGPEISLVPSKFLAQSSGSDQFVEPKHKTSALRNCLWELTASLPFAHRAVSSEP